jgi:hypothetical protein
LFFTKLTLLTTEAMQNIVPLAVLLLASLTLAATQSDQPIWLSPTNVNTSDFINWIIKLTSSLLWTFIGGNTTAGVNVDTVWGRNAYFGARWVPGCDIDESDRIWIFGGYSIQQTVKNGFFNDVWSFDTKTKEFQLEFGSSTSFRSGPAVVSDDFNTGNHPPSKQYPTLVDRKDGTLIMTGGWGTLTSGVAPAADAVLQNDVWLFNKTLKQWKLIDGDPTKDHLPGNFTHYRTPGSTMPGRYQQGGAKGMSLDGDLFIVGGVTGTVDVPIFLNDMWLIPFDQCASPTSHKCSSDAQCIEEMIGYSCSCNEGFVGDGFECTLPQPPSAVPPIESPLPVPESSVPIALEPPGTDPLAPSSQTPSVQSPSAPTRAPRSSIVASGANTIVASLTLLE